MKQIILSMAVAIIAMSSSCTKSTSISGGSGSSGNASIVGTNTNSTSKTIPELLTAHPWTLSQTIYNGINTIKPCQEDNEIIFRTTGICTENSHALCTGEAVDYNTKTWKYDAHTKILQIESTNQLNIQKYAIERIDNATLVLSPGTGIQLVYNVN
jgi:hypothetical protein